jgi:hypothetical protein
LVRGRDDGLFGWTMERFSSSFQRPGWNASTPGGP